MREILFRGKRLDNGEWAEGYLGQDTIIGNGNTWLGYVIKSIPQKLWDGGWFEIDPATVGQYTGLKDKNGKRIFEGDMLKVSWHAPRRETVYEIHEVAYSKSGFFTKRNGKLCGQVSNYISPNVNMRCEVIGNIHDNPELLEGGATK